MGGADLGSFFKDFRRFSTVQDFLSDLRKKYNRTTELMTIGSSYDGRDLKVLKIGHGEEGTKPAIWIDGGTHAREWITISTAMYTAFQLLTKYDSNSSVKSLVDKYHWYILPVVNPDGYEYSHTNDRMWRKNRRPLNGNGHFGVDLNRNFGYKWGTKPTGGEKEPHSGTYEGPSAFSENETTAISHFLSQRRDSLKVYLSLHCYSEFWLTPFAYNTTLPKDHHEMESVAEVGKNALRSYRGKTYRILRMAEWYPAPGFSIDWVYAELGVNYTYLLEIDSRKHGFVTPKSEILPIGEEVWRAVKAVSKHLN